MIRVLLSLVLAAIAAIAAVSAIVGIGMLAALFDGSRDNAISVYLLVGLPAVAVSIAAVVSVAGLWRR